MHGIIRMSMDGARTKIAEGLTFGEAFSTVGKLRAQRDGNYYWIGGLRK